MKNVLCLCQADPSEFVRRAAVHFVSRSHCTETAQPACLVTMFGAVVHDVDCDVKCAAVRFWRQYLPNIEISVTSLCCRTAVLAASVGCLLSAVLDCDRAVRLEALTTLVYVRQLVEMQPALLLLPKHSVAGSLSEDSSCNQICADPNFITATLKHLPQNIDCGMSVDDGRSSVAESCAANGHKPLSSTDGDMTDTASTLTTLRATLLSTNWDSLLASESQQSADCHSDNPMSLLDDILRTSRRENEISIENIDDDGQDSIIIDCY